MVFWSYSLNFIIDDAHVCSGGTGVICESEYLTKSLKLYTHGFIPLEAHKRLRVYRENGTEATLIKYMTKKRGQ